MNDPIPETNVFDVKLPKPGPRGLILRIAAIVLGLGVVAAAAAVIINRAAAPAGNDPVAQLMPANTMLFVSMTTHPDQQPNYSVISNAWQGSKEAKQLQSALIAALNYSGFDWETEIQPWLGDRVGAGLIDLGGFEKPITTTNPAVSMPHYRAPFFVLALQTRDRAKSDKFLTTFRQQISKNSSSGYYTVTLHDDNYRNIPIVYQTTESSGSGLSDGSAFATVNNVVVLTIGADNLKKVIDTALDGTNLAASGNFKTTMSALPGANVGALYMDLYQYMAATQAMMANLSTLTSPDTLNQQKAQLQQSEAILQALGGVGMAMTYEPSGLRFDFVSQFDPSKLPEQWRGLYPSTFTAASNRIFDTIPGTAIAAGNSNVPAGVLKIFMDPNYWSMVFANNPSMKGADIGQKIADFQKAAGIDLKTDLLDLFNGDMAFAVLPKISALTSVKPAGFNFPFDLAALIDSSDAARSSGSLDKIFTAIAAMPDSKGNLQVQPLNRAPYTALLDKHNNIMLAYGIVGNRLAIGSTPDTLDAINNAAQAPLSADAAFKEAIAVLPADRLSTGYFNLGPVWNMITAAAGGKNFTGAEYLSAFKWIAVGSQAPANGIQKGSMHIGLQPVKTPAISQ